MKLYEAHGKNVKITMKDGEVFQGHAYDYTSSYDNDPNPESITVNGMELYGPEICEIEIID